MLLTLNRRFAVGEATIGALRIDGAFQCFTLEDKVRPAKIANVTAIPAGDYAIEMSESRRFSDEYERRGLGRIVPLLVAVPGFEGVRIHVGNTAAETEGCILVGDWGLGAGAFVAGSAVAFRALLGVMKAAKTPIRITITEAIETLAGTGRFPTRAQRDALMAA
jgi:hypothetical protein